MPDIAALNGRTQHPLVNQEIERLRVTASLVINQVLKAFEMVAKHFIFFASFAKLFRWKNRSQLHLFLLVDNYWLYFLL